MKRMVKGIGMFALVAGLAVGMCGDAFAKSSGSRSSSSRSSTSRSYSSSSRSSGGGLGWSKPKATKPSTGTVKTAPKAKLVTKTSSTSTKAVKPKTGGGFGSSKKVDTGSTKYKSVNKKITKDFGTSTKTYKSKSAAKSDLSSKMASKKYTYSDPKTAMSNRPEHIPQSYQGRQTAYYGGSYGYYDNGMFMSYTAQQMLITDMMIHSYAPHATYHTAQPVRVVHHNSNSGLFLATFIVVVILGGVIVVSVRR